MRAGELDLYVEKGCDWERTLTLYKMSGSPINLALANIEMQIRTTAQAKSVICTPEIEIVKPATLGKVRIYISSEKTAQLPAFGEYYSKPTRYVYDMYIQYFYRRERILNGFLYVSPEVTK